MKNKYQKSWSSKKPQPTKEIMVKGETRRIIGRSSKLKVSDFSIFIGNVIQWCGENSIIIPKPKSIEIY